MEHLLYIPHGSDESLTSSSRQIVVLTFISHMVQMKVFSEVSIYIYNPFISHMVQMKDEGSVQALNIRFYFISHMVQMKDAKWFR